MGCYSSRPVRQVPPGQQRPPAVPGAGLRGLGQQAAGGAAGAAGTTGAAHAVGSPPPRVKLVLLGDSGVGKSCLVLRYVRGVFDPNSKITVGAAFMSHNVGLPDGRSVRFEIWDTAGQERYLSLAPLYYRGAHAACIVYDVTSAETFAKAKYWHGELSKNASNTIVMVLVGNKTDLAEDRQVSEEEGRAFADSHGMMFVETSAKTAANVADVFESCAAKLAGGSLPVSSTIAPVT